MILTLARKSLTSRWGRNLFMLFAIIFVVSFVAGSFVLADSMRKSFDDVFDELGNSIDLVVRTELVGTDEMSGALREPVPADVVATVDKVDGVAWADGDIQKQVVILDSEGDPLPGGPPTFGGNYPEHLLDSYILTGNPPATPDQAVLDQETADLFNYQIGGPLTVVTDNGKQEFTLSGTMKSESPTGGAKFVFFNGEAAPQILNATGGYDTITIKLADGANRDTVKAAVAKVLPDNTEVITGQEYAGEINDQLGTLIGYFSTGLLIFALITAFVSGFIINNVLGITIGQRLREVALLRAIGASGAQVRRLVIIESLLISATGTIFGIFGGVGVSKGLIAMFNALGAGFPPFGAVISLRTVLVSFVVGVGTVMVSTIVPARRAGKVPPVAAMRPEVGFAALGASRRLIGGMIVTGVGLTAFLIGLFARPGGLFGFAVFAGVGAITTFVGLSSLSTTVANPVSRFVGWPIAKVFGTPGRIARDNAARSPRRTARTSSALMIGVALIGAAALFGASLSKSLNSYLDKGFKFDYFVQSGGGQQMPAKAADEIAALPELRAVMALTGVDAIIPAGGSDQAEFINAVNPDNVEEFTPLGVSDGNLADLNNPDTIILASKYAEKGKIGVGDTIGVTFQNGVVKDLTVVALYTDDTNGNANISLDELDSVVTTPPMPFGVIALRDEGVDPATARAAIDKVAAEYPQLSVQDNAEFRKTTADQINTLLLVITTLLSGAILLSFVGIAVTLTMSVLERTREIGLLRAVGMTRRQLRRSVRWEAVIVTVFGVIVGSVVGIGIGYALASAVPGGFISQIAIPFGTIFFITIFAVVVALIAALFPAIKASKMDILKAVSSE